MNLAVINNATNEVKVFKGDVEVARATFSTYLEADQVEAMRVDPKAFLAALDAEEETVVEDLNPVSI